MGLIEEGDLAGSHLTPAYHQATRSGEAETSKFIMDGVWKGFTPPPLPEK